MADEAPRRRGRVAISSDDPAAMTAAALELARPGKRHESGAHVPAPPPE